MARKSTGKRLRFEVFKRDHFTCQYCGEQPPRIVLVADHIDPVAAGGETTIDNLISACESCNQGKAAKPLGDRAVRPDADLMYLEAQQEVAELRRYYVALEEKRRVAQYVVEELVAVWCDMTGDNVDWMPGEHLIQALISRYGAEAAEEAIRATAMKVDHGGITKRGNWTGYMYAVARNVAGPDEGAGE